MSSFEAVPSYLGIHAVFVSTANQGLRHTNAVNRRFALQSNARELLPDHRVKNCMRISSGGLVEIHHHADFQSASYGGLQTCASSHVCSICGAKIGERRALEISAGAAVQLDRHGDVIMATFTLQHSDTDELQALVRVLNNAYRGMRGGKRWQLFEQRYELSGSITSREYTFGQNGWHPHLHALMFVRGGLKQRELVEFEAWLRNRWGAALDKLGGFASWERGVKCQITNDGGLADYVSKTGRAWTVGDELAKANSKNGRQGGLTVPQLLWASGYGDERAGRLFQEYALVTANTSLIRWSPGLRKLLGLNEKEKTEEEIAGELAHGGRLLVVLEREQWHVILRHDARAELLLSAAVGDTAQVVAFLHQFDIHLEPWQFEPAFPAMAAPGWHPGR